MTSTQALIEQAEIEGYRDNCAVSDRQQTILQRKADLEEELRALVSEYQQLNADYVMREQQRRAQINAWRQTLAAEDHDERRDNPA